MISIVNRRYNTPKYPWEVMIDRTTPLGNPFPMNSTKDRVEERERVCDLYEAYFHEKVTSDPVFKAHVDVLINLYREYGKLTLVCWCSPFRCHGETIKRYIEEICKKNS